MRRAPLLDSIAQGLLELQKISPTQWLLRTLGAVMTVLSLVLIVGITALFSHFGFVLITLTVALGIILQVRRPDSDLGLLAPTAIVIALLAAGESSMLQAAGVGLLLMLAHSAFALAATIPVHGQFDSGAWRLAAAGLLPVLVLSAVAGVLVVALSTVQLGSWMMVVGALAAIGLFVAVLPRQG